MSEWRFLLDENIEPRVGEFLRNEGYDAEHVQSALSKGVDDETAVLPYAVEHDLVLVTADVSDFTGRSPDAHAGLLFLYDQRADAYDVANAIFEIVEAYETRDQFVSEPIDERL